MLKLSANTLATWCEELTHWKRPWCWERLKAGGEGDSRGWDGWMASPTWWTWVWASSRSWRWTGRPGVLQSTGSQRVRHDWATKLNWIYPKYYHSICNQYKQSLRCFTVFCTESSKSGLCLDFIKYAVKKVDSWYYLVVQWLTFYTPSAGGSGLIPDWGTRSHIPQLKILHIVTKTQHCQINNFF